MIKILTLLLSMILLAACNAEDTTTNEVLKAEDMFSKKKSENYVIFSPMEGVLLQDGKPLANTKIIRRLSWNGNDEGLVEEFATDEQGHFSLPLHEENLSLGMLSQFVASVSIETEIDGEIFDVWYNNKFENGLHVETDGEISDLVCDLREEEVVLQAGLSKILTTCRWKGMPKSEM